ncbi:uncharacterized protein [Periplaneta americana]|uniref:uncharacterized protein isoform X3 n=1 Tax=Periplaneta americana TaxID=6978 RepID=UPI0037E8BC6D
MSSSSSGCRQVVKNMWIRSADAACGRHKIRRWCFNRAPDKEGWIDISLRFSRSVGFIIFMSELVLFPTNTCQLQQLRVFAMERSKFSTRQ